MEASELIARFPTEDPENLWDSVRPWLETETDLDAVRATFDGILTWLTPQDQRPDDRGQINAAQTLVHIVESKQLKNVMPSITTLSKLLRRCECREVQLLLTRTVMLLLQRESQFATPFTTAFVNSTRNTLKALRRAGVSDACRKDAEAALRDIPARR